MVDILPFALSLSNGSARREVLRQAQHERYLNKGEWL